MRVGEQLDFPDLGTAAYIGQRIPGEPVFRCDDGTEVEFNSFDAMRKALKPKRKPRKKAAAKKIRDMEDYE